MISMQDQISLTQILNSVKNHRYSYDYKTSLTLSQDYNPEFSRYSRQGELQEITLQVQQQQLQVEEQVAIVQQNSFDKVKFLVNQNKSQSQILDGQVSLVKKISLNKNNSRLKKKQSLKKQEDDQFSKKYGQMFDQIFFKKEEPSTLITINQNQKQSQKIHQQDQFMLNQNLSLSIQQKSNQFSQSQIVNKSETVETKTKIQSTDSVNQELKQIHKNVILRQDYCLSGKNDNKIKYQQQIVQNQNLEINQKIKIQHEKNDFSPLSVKEPSKLLKFIIFQPKKQLPPQTLQIQQFDQNRVPIFLRKLKELNANYPNFHNLSIFTQVQFTKINKQYLQLVNVAKQAIRCLKQAHLRIYEIVSMKDSLYKQLSNNIIFNNSRAQFHLYQNFTIIDWQKLIYAPQIDKIRPRDSFHFRPLNQKYIVSFLTAHQQLVESLPIEPFLDLKDVRTIKKYIKIRQQLWATQKNMEIISEDLYVDAVSKMTFPQHILQAREMLIQMKANQTIKMDSKKQKLVQTLVHLKQNNDVFGSSYLGILTLQVLKGSSK